MIRVLRTSLLTLVLGGAIVAGVFAFVTTRHERLLAELQATNDRMTAQLEMRELMIERLLRTSRVAHLQVLEQQKLDDGTISSTALRFVELDEDGAELARQEFTVPGHIVMIDAWTVQFDRERVTQGHPLAGHTLVLLRRIYSDMMRPVDGFDIDTPGAIPPAYAVTEAGRFQQQVWEHFWTLATDAKAAESMGVRVAQGEVVYKPVRSGQTYELTVDAAGGMSLVPLLARES